MWTEVINVIFDCSKRNNEIEASTSRKCAADIFYLEISALIKACIWNYSITKNKMGLLGVYFLTHFLHFADTSYSDDASTSQKKCGKPLQWWNVELTLQYISFKRGFFRKRKLHYVNYTRHASFIYNFEGQFWQWFSSFREKVVNSDGATPRLDFQR